MAAPWAAGVKLRIIGKVQGQDCINVMHFATNTVINDAPTRDALILALLTAMLQCCTEKLLPAVSSDYTLLGVDATPIHPQKGDATFKAADPNSVGQLSQSSVSFVATLMEVRTGLGGRSHRGRNFLPPVGEANTANSLIDGGALLDLVEFVTCVAGKFIGQAATEAWRLGVFSRKLAGAAPGDFNAGFTEATQLIVKPAAAKMSSRKIGSGN